VCWMFDGPLSPGKTCPFGSKEFSWVISLSILFPHEILFHVEAPLIQT
jgi:hypothetical protein